MRRSGLRVFCQLSFVALAWLTRSDMPQEVVCSPTETRGRQLLGEAHAAEKRLSAQRSRRPTDDVVVKATSELRGKYRELILEHYQLATRKGVERSLWLLVFHRRIETYRGKIRKAQHAVQENQVDANSSRRDAAKDSMRRAMVGLAQVLDKATSKL